jgi:hypothetical protein
MAQTLVLCLLGGAFGILLAAGTLPLLRLALAHTATLDQSMVQSIVGVVIGFVVALVSARLIGSLLFHQYNRSTLGIDQHLNFGLNRGSGSERSCG